MKKLKPGQIAQVIERWIQTAESNKRLGVKCIKAYLAIVGGNTNNFMVFDNAGGQDFHIWMDKVTSPNLDVKGIIESETAKYAFFYRVDEEEFVGNHYVVYGDLKEAYDFVQSENEG